MKIRNICFGKILLTAPRKVYMRMCKRLYAEIILTRLPESIAGQKQLKKMGISKREGI